MGFIDTEITTGIYQFVEMYKKGEKTGKIILCNERIGFEGIEENLFDVSFNEVIYPSISIAEMAIENEKKFQKERDKIPEGQDYSTLYITPDRYYDMPQDELRKDYKIYLKGIKIINKETKIISLFELNKRFVTHGNTLRHAQVVYFSGYIFIPENSCFDFSK